MYDFLTFKKFISSDVLIFFYYFFALLMPVVFYLMRNKILNIKILNTFFPKLKNYTFDKLNFKEKLILTGCILFCFVMCEIFLRMFFEFLIAYIQIRNALAG